MFHFSSLQRRWLLTNDILYYQLPSMLVITFLWPYFYSRGNIFITVSRKLFCNKYCRVLSSIIKELTFITSTLTQTNFILVNTFGSWSNEQFLAEPFLLLLLYYIFLYNTTYYTTNFLWTSYVYHLTNCFFNYFLYVSCCTCSLIHFIV